MPEYRPAPFDLGGFDLLRGVQAGSQLLQILGQRQGGPVGPGPRARREAAAEKEKERGFVAGEAEKNRQAASAEAEKGRQAEDKKALRTKEDFLNRFKTEQEAMVRGGMDPKEAGVLILDNLRAEAEGNKLKIDETRARIEQTKAGTKATEQSVDIAGNEEERRKAEEIRKDRIFESTVKRAEAEAEQAGLKTETDRIIRERLEEDLSRDNEFKDAKIRAVEIEMKLAERAAERDDKRLENEKQRVKNESVRMELSAHQKALGEYRNRLVQETNTALKPLLEEKKALLEQQEQSKMSLAQAEKGGDKKRIAEAKSARDALENRAKEIDGQIDKLVERVTESLKALDQTAISRERGILDKDTDSPGNPVPDKAPSSPTDDALDNIKKAATGQK